MLFWPCRETVFLSCLLPRGGQKPGSTTCTAPQQLENIRAEKTLALRFTGHFAEEHFLLRYTAFFFLNQHYTGCKSWYNLHRKLLTINIRAVFYAQMDRQAAVTVVGTSLLNSPNVCNRFHFQSASQEICLADPVEPVICWKYSYNLQTLSFSAKLSSSFNRWLDL